MNLDNRLWAIISVVLVGAIVAAGWFLGASPLLAARAEANEQLVEALADNQQHAATLLALKAASEELDELQERAVALEKAIPSDLESSPLITAMNDLATATGVTITAIGIQDGVSYQQPSAPEESAETPAGGGETGGAPEPLTDARITAENFVLVPISIEVSGPLTNVLAFIHGIQTGERLVLVTGLATSADGENASTYSSMITGTTYVLRRSPALQIGATLDPAPTPAPTPTPTGTATPNPSDPATPTPTPTSTAGP